MDVHLRSAAPDDLPAIGALAVRTGLFDEDVAGVLRGCIDGDEPGEVWVASRGDSVVGGAYVAPEPFAASMWNLYFLAVDPDDHGSGTGTALVRHVEDLARAAPVDTLVIETSGLERYARTRSFYEGLGYALEARIRDFYGRGDDKIVYWKSFRTDAAAESTA